MPLTKRVLFSPSSFQPIDQIIEVDADPSVHIHSYAQLLGTIRQLSCLSSYALEIFQNLAVLTEDIHERTKVLSVRTSSAIGKFVEYDRGVRNAPLQPDLTFNRLSRKYLKFRELSTPPIFVKTTNYSSILIQYKICRTAPQLWRIENVIGEDCFQFYSYPGFFFEDWLKSEIIKQEIKKEQRKKEKALKKQQKKERRKMREELGLSSFKRHSSSQRPRSLLRKEVKESPSSLEEQEKGTLKEIRGNENEFAQAVPSNSNEAASASAAKSAKKAGLSAVFGFLTKERTGQTDGISSSKPVSPPSEGEVDGASKLRIAERRKNQRERKSLSMDMLSLQILNNKFKTEAPEEYEDEHIGVRGSTNLSGVGLFEQIPNYTAATNVNYLIEKERPAISARERSVDFNVHEIIEPRYNAPQGRAFEDDEEEQDPFSFATANRRPQMNYQTSTKLGKYLSSKRTQENTAGITLSANSNQTARLSTTISQAQPLLLSKKFQDRNAPGNNVSPVTISLLPTTSSAPFPHSKSIESNPIPESSDSIKARKRASVIFSPNFLSTVSHTETRDEVAKSTQLVETLRADVFAIAKDAHRSDGVKFTVLKDSFDRIVEEEEEEEGFPFDLEYENERKQGDPSPDFDFDEPEVEEGEGLISSSRPFTQYHQPYSNSDDDLPPVDDIDGEDDFQEENFHNDEEQPNFESSSRSEMSSLSKLRVGSVNNRPPPPPPPPKERVKSAVGEDVLANIRTGSSTLRRVEPEERVVDMRTKLLGQIKDGGAKLRAVQVQSKKINNAMQNAAVAAILANRSKIAGSDSESDSEDDSVFTDEDYG